MPNQLFRNLAILSTLAASSALGDQLQPSASFSADEKFQPGWHEATIGSSVYISDIIVRSDKPEPYYVSGFLQSAYTVTAPGGDSPSRGSFQIAPEVFGAGVFHGPGTRIFGATLWFRYLFVQPDWRFVPFIEGGAGVTDMNIPHYYDGKDFNFNLDLGAGVRYFVCPHCSLNAEYRFQHISNADIWDHNVGVNAGGPSVSATFYF